MPNPQALPTTCFHCGEVIPAGIHYPIQFQGAEHDTCCAGCQAVAQTILQCGLESYYLQRQQNACRFNPLPTEILEQIALYDDPLLQQSFVLQESMQIRDAALLLDGISCAACIWLIEQHIGRLPGVLSIQIHYHSHRARIRWDESQIHLSSILQAITAIGYRAEPYDRIRAEALWQQRRKTSLLRIWIAGLAMMQVMMFALPTYLADAGDIEARWMVLMNWASFILTLPVVFYACQPFFISCWRDLSRRHAGMDLPVSIGIVSSFLISLWNTGQGHGAVYFDSVCMFVFLLLVGRYLLESAQRQTSDATERLVKLIPAFAHRLDADGQTREVAVAQLLSGERILVKPGEIIAADGQIEAGHSEINESLINGESRGISKGVGDQVLSGSSNLTDTLVVRIEKTGAATRLSAIVRLLDQTLAQKPRLSHLNEQIARWFVLLLLLSAGLSFGIWHWLEPAHALPAMVAVLIVSCPCALSLAAPAAQVAAHGRLARMGILVARSLALDNLGQIKHIVFDKTGTLTNGKPELKQIRAFTGDTDKLCSLAAALEAGSSHPIAHAFSHFPHPQATDCMHHPAKGISGWIEGQEYALGNASLMRAFCTQNLPDSPDANLWLGDRQQILACFTLTDALRADASHCIEQLRQQGIRIHILSGDHPQAVAHTAKQLSVTDFNAEFSPEQKLAWIKALQESKDVVLMVGDGLNDGPVLAAASVSIAMGEGVDVSQAAADMILLNNRLAVLPQAIWLASFYRHILRQNLIWAFAYNLIAIPVAIAGWLSPWLASVGMASSSLLVVLNALRITRYRES